MEKEVVIKRGLEISTDDAVIAIVRDDVVKVTEISAAEQLSEATLEELGLESKDGFRIFVLHYM